MSPSRFNHTFTILMLLAGASAFLIPTRYTDKVTPQVQMLFAPVAKPARAVGAWAAGRAGTDLPPDTRSAVAIRVENQQLVEENIKLRHDLDELRRINGEREKLGELRALCTPVPVLGGDAGMRESLAVSSSSLEGLHDGMYVLSPGVTGVQIVGKLQRSGMAGGQVQLITNPGFRFTAYFVGSRRIESADPAAAGKAKSETAYVRLHKDPVLVEGVGRQQMVVRQIKLADAKAWGLQDGDSVILEDSEWPNRLRGKRVGRVSGVRPHKDNPLFVEIRITPLSDLLRLREVMVLTKQ